MAYLQGLEGTNNKKLEVKEFFNTGVEAMKQLKQYGYACGAGDKGAINIWKDDEGFYRGVREFFRRTMSEIKCSSEQLLEKWLYENIPLIK